MHKSLIYFSGVKPATKSSGIDFSSYLPAEIVVYFLGFLPVSSLLPLGACSRTLRRLVNDNSIWQALCAERWKGKAGLEGLFQEKNDILWTVMDGWKRAYVVVEKERKRTTLNMFDLIDTKWRLIFNTYPDHDIGEATFRDNYTYEHSVGDIMTWRPIPGNRIQVYHYPPLTPSRVTSDWSWRLDNGFATLRTTTGTGLRRALNKLEREIKIELEGMKGYSNAYEKEEEEGKLLGFEGYEDEMAFSYFFF